MPEPTAQRVAFVRLAARVFSALGGKEFPHRDCVNLLWELYGSIADTPPEQPVFRRATGARQTWYTCAPGAHVWRVTNVKTVAEMLFPSVDSEMKVLLAAASEQDPFVYASEGDSWATEKSGRLDGESMVKVYAAWDTIVQRPGFYKGVAKLLQLDVRWGANMEEQLDSKAHLLAFSDKLYDLHVGHPRRIEREDFIGRTTTYSIDEIIPETDGGRCTHENMNSVLTFLLSLFGDDHGRRSVLMTGLCMTLMGAAGGLQRCLHLVGGGADGKSILVNLVKEALGDYSCDLPSNYFALQAATKSNEAPNPAAAAATICRGVFVPEAGDTTLAASVLKGMVGGDNPTFRPLYSVATPKQKWRGTIVLVGNDPYFVSLSGTTSTTIKDLQKRIGALQRRFFFVEFPQTFFQPNGALLAQYDANDPTHRLAEEDIEKKFSSWRGPMMLFMLTHFHQFMQHSPMGVLPMTLRLPPVTVAQAEETARMWVRSIVAKEIVEWASDYVVGSAGHCTTFVHMCEEYERHLGDRFLSSKTKNEMRCGLKFYLHTTSPFKDWYGAEESHLLLSRQELHPRLMHVRQWWKVRVMVKGDDHPIPSRHTWTRHVQGPAH
jgi:hypothetical protein